MPRRVLIVDDAEAMRAVLRSILSRNGYEVIGEAEDGEEAARMFTEQRPDIVLLDVMMPRMDGLETLKAILAADARAKVIMCTADGSREAVVDSLQAGAVDFVIKPFSTERLLQAIRKAHW